MCVLTYNICAWCYHGHPKFTDTCPGMHPPLLYCPNSTRFHWVIVPPEQCYLFPYHVAPRSEPLAGFEPATNQDQVVQPYDTHQSYPTSGTFPQLNEDEHTHHNFSLAAVAVNRHQNDAFMEHPAVAWHRRRPDELSLASGSCAATSRSSSPSPEILANPRDLNIPQHYQQRIQKITERSNAFRAQQQLYQQEPTPNIPYPRPPHLENTTQRPHYSPHRMGTSHGYKSPKNNGPRGVRGGPRAGAKEPWSWKHRNSRHEDLQQQFYPYQIIPTLPFYWQVTPNGLTPMSTPVPYGPHQAMPQPAYNQQRAPKKTPALNPRAQSFVFSAQGETKSPPSGKDTAEATYTITTSEENKNIAEPSGTVSPIMTPPMRMDKADDIALTPYKEEFTVVEDHADEGGQTDNEEDDKVEPALFVGPRQFRGVLNLPTSAPTPTPAPSRASSPPMQSGSRTQAASGQSPPRNTTSVQTSSPARSDSGSSRRYEPAPLLQGASTYTVVFRGPDGEWSRVTRPRGRGMEAPNWREDAFPPLPTPKSK